MRFKVELDRDVADFLRTKCVRGEVDWFYRQLERVCRDPIKNSEAIQCLGLSRYILRFFRFAGCAAIFEFDAARGRIKVLTCRRLTSNLPTERKPEARGGR